MLPGLYCVLNNLFKGLATKSDIVNILSVYLDYFELNINDNKLVLEFTPAQKCLNNVFNSKHNFGMESQILIASEVLALLGFVGWISLAFYNK